jgi:hypothetical protein
VGGAQERSAFPVHLALLSHRTFLSLALCPLIQYARCSWERFSLILFTVEVGIVSILLKNKQKLKLSTFTKFTWLVILKL